jgi:polyisoprenoid-binding protein YceI
MKKIILSSVSIAVILVSVAFAPSINKLVSNKTHIKFFSTTTAEDIEAHNYASVSTIDTQTGDVVFSVPMQSFEFKIPLMQKHFNSEAFLDTKQFTKAKLVGKITNLSEINFNKDGSYSANIKGEMTIHGKTNPINEKATIVIAGKSVKVTSKFNILLADYGVAFEKGKPSSNIAKTVEVTVDSEYLFE